MSHFLIVCGGTGGHLAPGISIGEALLERGHSCKLLISRKAVDAKLIEKYPGLAFLKAPGRAFSGGLLSLPKSIFALMQGFFFARRLIRSEQPDLILAFGGFLSFGIVLAARLNGVPVALHEANCVPGKSIRYLRRLAHRIYLPEGVSLKGVGLKVVRNFGYPVRKDVVHILKADAYQALEIEVHHKLLVVLGGSQGAAALNQWARDNFAALACKGITLYCVTGLDKGAAERLCEKAKDGVEVYGYFVPFTKQMGELVSAADLIISRAGAGSIAEITRCRAPSLLIPYPFAADDHQQANAAIHEKHGACVVLPQTDLHRLRDEVETLIFNDWLLSQFKLNMTKLDQENEVDLIARDLEGLIHGPSESDSAQKEVSA